MQRVFLAGRVPALAGTGGGAWLLRWLSVKMGSSECVKSLHEMVFGSPEAIFVGVRQVVREMSIR